MRRLLVPIALIVLVIIVAAVVYMKYYSGNTYTSTSTATYTNAISVEPLGGPKYGNVAEIPVASGAQWIWADAAGAQKGTFEIVDTRSVTATTFRAYLATTAGDAVLYINGVKQLTASKVGEPIANVMVTVPNVNYKILILATNTTTTPAAVLFAQKNTNGDVIEVSTAAFQVRKIK